MALRWFLALTLLCSLLLPVTALKAQTLDQYGGYASMPVAGGATGHFRVAKLGTRWVLVTPLGNAFWMRGVANVMDDAAPDGRGGTYSATVQAKYGSQATWATQEALRLQTWGFNALNEYAHVTMWNRLPGIFILNATYYGLQNRYVTGVPQAFKDVMNGVDLAAYNGYRGFVADFFDPNFSLYVNAFIAQDISGYKANGVYGSASTVGFITDDRDYLFGFGPGPEIPPATHPHVGWLVLVTNPQQSSNPSLGQTYTDAKVYAKYALRDQLVATYGTIGALNAAWGSNYSTFDSAGGWGTGTGLLDEKGTHAWVPSDAFGLTGAPAAMVADLDKFLLAYGRQYFTTYRAKILANISGSPLVFGPSAFNSDGLTRNQLLQAAGESCDVIQASFASQQAYTLTARYAGDVPILAYEIMWANPDSAMFSYANPSGLGAFTTQTSRGQAYAAAIANGLAWVNDSGTNTIVGIKWWEFRDRLSGSEATNFGLVTLTDNAYDGKEAIIATGTDPWGYRTGGEIRNYGDFLSSVVAAHSNVSAVLGAGGGGSTPPGSTPPSSTSPNVTITSPSSGSTVQQSVTVSATASSTVSRVNLALDGQIMAVVGGSTATYPWNTLGTPNGSHQWVANATDTSGIVSTSAPVVVTVSNVPPGDNTAPTVTITQPSNGSYVTRRSTIAITAAASDNIGVVRVEFYVNGALKCTVGVAPYGCGWQVPASSGKSYRLQAKAYDASGNVGSSNIVTVGVKQW